MFSSKDNFGGKRLLGWFTPSLIKDEITQGIKNKTSLVVFDWLNNMGVVAEDDFGARGDKLAGKFDLPRGGFRLVLIAPMKGEDKDVGLRRGKFGLGEDFFAGIGG